MSKPLSAKILVPAIKKIFLEQNKYQMNKNIVEFTKDGKYIGDYFNFVIFELRGNKPPIFYHVASPFELFTKKAPEQALVFENGQLVLNIDFADYVIMRTGIMDALVLQAVGIKSLKNKQILYFGSGNICHWSLKYLKETYPELTEIDFVNQSNKNEEFVSFFHKLGVQANPTKNLQINKYDYIFCHTNTSAPLLRANDIAKIKQGALITSTITSTEHGELADEFFNTNHTNIIVDWKDTVLGAKELKRGMESKKVVEKKLIYLKDLLSGEKKLDPKAKYTIYRSAGTPMQNLAVLKLLLK